MSGKYFDTGVHKVAIRLFEFDTDEKDREYVDVSVTDPETEEKEATVRFWFHTDGAIKYSFNMLRDIFVHNAEDNKKDEVRAKFDALPNTTELEKACAKMLIGKEAFLRVSKSDRTYESQGKIKNSYDRELYGHEVEPIEETAPVQNDGQAEVTKEDTKGDGNLPLSF